MYWPLSYYILYITINELCALMISKHNREPNRPNLNLNISYYCFFLFYRLDQSAAHIMKKLFSHLGI